MKSSRRNVYYYTLATLIVLTTFRGIINNFIFINNGTLLVDICILTTLFLFILHKRIKMSSIIYHYFLWSVLCFLDLLIQLFINRTTIRDGILAYRNDVVYTFPFAFIIFCVDKDDLYTLYSLVRNLAFPINIFAICQFIFRGVLPKEFLVLNGEPTFGFAGIDIVRVTGLMGNTVVYGGFAVLIISFIWAEIIAKRFKTPFLWLQLITAVTANLFTFNRASIAGMVLIMLLEYVLSIPRHKVKIALKRYFLLFVIVIVATVIIVNHFSDSVVIQRFLGKNELWTKDNDNAHWEMINNAIIEIKKYPIIGYGAGTVGYSSLGGIKDIIGDGTFWIYLLEWGIPICVIYWFLVARMMKVAFSHRQDKNKFLSSISLGYIGANTYLIGASVINSAYSARCTVILLWILAGILVKETRESNLLYSKSKNDYSVLLEMASIK